MFRKGENLIGLKVLMAGMSFGMIILVIRTCMQSNMFALPPAVTNEPWFITTLVDFYFNITLLSLWVVYRENNLLRSVVWIIAFVFLGSIATCFYVLLQLLALKPGEGLDRVLLRKI